MLKKAKKSRSSIDKFGVNRDNNRKLTWLLCKFEDIDDRLRWIHRIMVAQGLGNLEESDIQRVFEDHVDSLIFDKIKEVGLQGIFPKDVAAWINTQGDYDLQHYHISRRILRMNKRLHYETGEFLFEKRGHKWALTSVGFDA